VSVILKDGRQINQVAIVDRRIAQIRGLNNIPFKEDDIDQIIVTHENWDFSKDKLINKTTP
jgi:hypothetical protein